MERPGRLGEPVELPWWTPVALVPPVLGLLGGLLLGAPPEARITVLAFSALLAWVIITVATRVTSSNMQSVWISAAYAFWFFIVVVWAVIVATGTQ